MPFSCCVWRFRRWLSSTLYQTTATFALGGRPLYVESLHWYPSDFRFVTLPALCLSSPAHIKRLHCSVCVDVCTSVCSLIWECYACICVDVSWLYSMSILMPRWCQYLLQWTPTAGVKSVSGLLLCSRLLDNNWTYFCCQAKTLHLLHVSGTKNLT